MDRRLIVALLAFWLAVGPAAAALAQSAERPCESMGFAMPAGDCCGEGMGEAKCLSACLAAAPAIAATGARGSERATTPGAVASPPVLHASVLAPPDIAPPKTPVS